MRVLNFVKLHCVLKRFIRKRNVGFFSASRCINTHGRAEMAAVAVSVNCVDTAVERSARNKRLTGVVVRLLFNVIHLSLSMSLYLCLIDAPVNSTIADASSMRLHGGCALNEPLASCKAHKRLYLR